MTIRAPGTKAILGDDILVNVTGAVIRQNGYVTYEINWIHDGQRHEVFAFPYELKDTPDDNRTLTVGFSHDKSTNS